MIFLGFSPHHSSRVLLVLNTHTGWITPQFQVVFDDWFTSVISTYAEKTCNMMKWAQLFTNACYQYGFDDDDPVILADDWIVASEDNINHSSQVHLHEKRCASTSEGDIRGFQGQQFLNDKNNNLS